MTPDPISEPPRATSGASGPARRWEDRLLTPIAGSLLIGAASTSADFFSQAEAAFALWEMQVREHNLTAVVATARGLARDFPDNHELTRFLEKNQVVVASR